MQPRPMAETGGPPMPSFREAIGWVVIAVPLTGQSCGLRGKMAGHTDVEPVMDSGGQIDDFDGHGEVLCKCRSPRSNGQRAQVTPRRQRQLGCSTSDCQISVS